MKTTMGFEIPKPSDPDNNKDLDQLILEQIEQADRFSHFLSELDLYSMPPNEAVDLTHRANKICMGHIRVILHTIKKIREGF